MSGLRGDQRRAVTASVTSAMEHQGKADQSGSAADSDGMNQGMRVLSHLIAGVLLYGALGWVGDHFLHTRFLLPIGIVLGAALGIYTTIKRLGVTDAAALGASAPAGRSARDQTTHVTEGER